jgi:hypothetical protein
MFGPLPDGSVELRKFLIGLGPAIFSLIVIVRKEMPRMAPFSAVRGRSATVIGWIVLGFCLIGLLGFLF